MTLTSAEEVKISDIIKLEDYNHYYCIIGSIINVDKEKYMITIDDGSAQLDIQVSNIYEIGNTIRIFGKKIYNTNILKAYIIQDFSNFNVDVYRKIKYLEEYI